MFIQKLISITIIFIKLKFLKSLEIRTNPTNSKWSCIYLDTRNINEIKLLVPGVQNKFKSVSDLLGKKTTPCKGIFKIRNYGVQKFT